METTYVRVMFLGALIGLAAASADGASRTPFTAKLLIPTATAITGSKSSSVYGEYVLFNATVTASSGTAQGTVTFYDRDGAPVPQPAPAIGSGTLLNGSASLLVRSLPAGGHLIFATYEGNSTFDSSSSGLVGLTVSPASTSVTISVSPNPSTLGQAVTFTADVVPSTSGTPPGSVTFKDGTSTLGSATLSGGEASISTATLAVGTHSISAVYGGDSNYTGSTSSVVTEKVNPGLGTTSTVVVSSLNPSVVGQAVTFSAVIYPSNSGTPTGAVTFKDGGATLGSGSLSSDTASFTTSSLAVGTHSITAVYGGDASYTGSTSSPLPQTVNQSSATDTTTTLISSSNPSVAGQSVTFTATVAPTGPGAPSGVVVFWDGSNELGNFALAGNHASLSTSSLSVGSHSITAVYGGDATFSGSTSAALTQVVNAATTATSTSIASSVNPSAPGQSVTFTARVTASGSGGTPSGSVTFQDGSGTLGSSPLSNAEANFTTSALSVGSHSITAVYGGDTKFAGSTSGVLVQTVNAGSGGTPLTFSCGAAGSAQVGTDYSLMCTASGGLSPYTFSVSAGTLPPGLGLTPSGATLRVAGEPTTPGSYTFTLQAADSSTPAFTATQSVSVTVAASSSALSVSPAAGLTFTAYQGRGNPAPQTLSLASTGGSSSFAIANAPAWVAESPTSGVTPATITVTVNAGMLAAGPSSGIITIEAANGQQLSVNIQANLAAFSIGAVSPVNETVAPGAAKNDSLAVTTIDNGPASVDAVATTMSGGNWLTLSSATLTAPGGLAYTIDASGLSAGNYIGTITLSCAASNPCSPVPVTVNLAVSQSAAVAITQVLNATGEAAFISQNTWIEIKGTNLSATKRTWQASDFDPNTGLMPTELDGVSVTVNGKPAYVYYISPTQVNVLTPVDAALGTVSVQLTNSMGTSAVVSVAMLENSLGFFTFNSGEYAAATHADGSLLGAASLYPGLTTPAKAGETIVLYGNGFGETDPPIIDGQAVQQGVLPNKPVVTIGGLAAVVTYAAVVSPGLYQFNVIVPANAPAGDRALVATYNGVSTQPGVFITIGQ
jgi:uncharacterized protein (TIGR03437 family)